MIYLTMTQQKFGKDLVASYTDYPPNIFFYLDDIVAGTEVYINSSEVSAVAPSENVGRVRIDFPSSCTTWALCQTYIAQHPELKIVYKRTTSYTEQVVTNQPLLNLDSNGCDFLRNEWEKGLNLWNFGIYQGVWNSNGTYDSTISIRCRTNPITDFSVIKKGVAYTFVCSFVVLLHLLLHLTIVILWFTLLTMTQQQIQQSLLCQVV